jgi:hypothetical protein
VRDVSADRLIQKTISTRMRESPEGCADENTMAAYLEGNLSPQETAAFEDHVSECASCQEILALSMKLQADEATSQTTAEQGTGKRTLFYSHPRSWSGMRRNCPFSGVVPDRKPIGRRPS